MAAAPPFAFWEPPFPIRLAPPPIPHTPTGQDDHPSSINKRPWLEPGTTQWEPASWPFFPRWGPSSSASGCHTPVVRSRRRRVREQGCSAVLRLADGGVPWAGDGPSGINRSTTSTVFPPVCRPLMISGACWRLLPVPPRRVMPDRDITAPQSLAQAHWLEETDMALMGV